MKTLGYYNGKFGPLEEMTVPMNDRACYFGDGVYEAKIPRKMTAVLHQERRELLTHFVKTFLLWIHRTVTLSHVQQQKSAPMRC